MFTIIYFDNDGKRAWIKATTEEAAKAFIANHNITDFEITISQSTYRNMKNDIELLENNILALKDLANKMELKH